MEKAGKPKGTVTSLSSLFPVEDAEKAAQRVHDTIADNQQRLDQLRGFAADNTSLINLVGRLPDNLHHDVMVPFGKAAFFPGRLVHTNEFMVLLGEGYYAERTSKQTVDILKRRGKALESQVHSLNAMVEDLKLEASFFSATASEATEGALHITEFEEESSCETESEPGPLKQDSPGSSGANIRKVANEDEEFARIMSRMDELEREELEAESEMVSEEEESKSEFGAQSDNESDEEEKVKADVHQLSDHKSLDQNLKFYEESFSRKPTEQKNDRITANREKFTDRISCSGLTVQSIAEDRSSSGKVLASNVKSSLDKGSLPSEDDNVQAVPLSRSQVPPQSSKPEFDVQKAFPGSIVERTHNLQINSREQSTPNSQSSGSQPSKPVSRFKMQRR